MKTSSRNVRRITPQTLGLCTLLAVGSLIHSATAQPTNTGAGYSITNLVSNIDGFADNTDTNLLNAWGMVVDSKGFTVNANGTSLAGRYSKRGEPAGIYIGVDCDRTGKIKNSSGG